MRGNWMRVLLLPIFLLMGLGACASNAVQPGIVYSAGVPSGSGPGPYYGGNGQYNGGYQGSGPYYGNNGGYQGSGPYYGNGPYPNTTQVASAPSQLPPQGSNASGAPGDAGRVVSIREVAMQGGGAGSYGPSQGTFMGGLLGAMSGATVGAVTTQTVGGGIVGGLLGLVGGAIVGTIASGNQGYAARGIEVTVQRDDGQQVTVAQRDDGDIQLGDRVQIVQNRQGVAQVVRDAARAPD
ncbi:MAG: hypothetical protein JOY64_13810 [Alphaproteobacteria bacterium]|nr:hypothetical protein [Alphaproteobacteria bacterium]MBV8408706.1 hypothetical protein [Alphaproteobacteria bacterium]